MTSFFFRAIRLRFLAAILLGACVMTMNFNFPKLSEADAAEVQLKWTTPDVKNVAGYRIYYGVTHRDYQSRIDIGKRTSYVLSDLSEGKIYHIAIVAYDWLGNESNFSEEIVYNAPWTPLPSATSLVSGSLQNGTVSLSSRALTETDSAEKSEEQILESNYGASGSDSSSLAASLFFRSFFAQTWLEAEDGFFDAPIATGSDDELSKVRYVWIPNGEPSIPSDHEQTEWEIHYEFQVPRTGEYVIWGRVFSTNEARRPFLVSVDDGKFVAWEVPTALKTNWGWSRINEKDQGTPVFFFLGEGRHTLILKLRNIGEKIDKILLTNDLRKDLCSQLQRSGALEN